jgi:hypothetical protein
MVNQVRKSGLLGCAKWANNCLYMIYIQFFLTLLSPPRERIKGEGVAQLERVILDVTCKWKVDTDWGNGLINLSF